MFTRTLLLPSFGFSSHDTAAASSNVSPMVEGTVVVALCSLGQVEIETLPAHGFLCLAI